MKRILKKELIFCAYVFGDYSRYIPYYIFGILSIYPQHYVKIFLNKELSDSEKQALKYINSTNYEIIENYSLKVNLPQNYIRYGNEKLIRWLLPYDEFKDFKYAYFGDIDILIKQENPTLLSEHINHMNALELPYSNVIRKKFKRLTGLHFIDVKNYYSKVSFHIQDIIDNPPIKHIENMIEDEDFLYYLINRSIGFSHHKEYMFEKEKYAYRPHHGVHLGLLRTDKKEEAWNKRINYFKDNMPHYINENNLAEMLQVLPIEEILFLKNKMNEKNI